MNNVKSSGAVVGTSLLSAFAASLCCITPVIAMLAGSSSIIANFSWLEPARPYLISLSVIVLAFAWYQQLKPVKTSTIDCNCETTTKTSFLQSKGLLGIITLIAALMMTFPLYAKIFYPQPNRQELIDATNSAVSFYKAPLVCQAAPSIGCGSKAKFLLTELEKNKTTVESAWLNRKGTVVAVKWAANADEKQKNDILKTVGTSHNIELTLLSTNEAGDHAKTFPDNNWLKGKDVDNLSKEEATIIAKKTIEGYKKDGLVKASFEKEFQAEIEKIYASLFLSISSYQDLNTEAYNKVEEQIQKVGEKYVGKGKMPRVELCVADESCEKDKSCSEGEKSCCEKK